MHARTTRRAFIPAAERTAKADSVPTRDDRAPWVHAVSAVAQVGVLILAGFGYFYTVVPVYQKELLDEQIARKEKQIIKQSDALAALEVRSANLEAARFQQEKEASDAKARVLEEQEKFTALQAEMHKRRAALEHELAAAESRLTAVQQDADMWSRELARSRALQVYGDAALSNCMHVFADKRPLNKDMLTECMANALVTSKASGQLPERDLESVRGWIHREALSSDLPLTPETSLRFYGWAALRRDFPVALTCLRAEEDRNPGAPYPDAKTKDECDSLRPVALAVGRSIKFFSAVETAVRNVVTAVERKDDFTKFEGGSAVPRAPFIIAE